MKLDTNTVLLLVVLVLAFYYACECRKRSGEPFNNLKMMLCNEKGSSLSPDYNTRAGAGSENDSSRSVLTGVVGSNGAESLVRAEITPTDLSYEMYGIPSGVTRSGCDIDIYNLNEVQWTQYMRKPERDGEYKFGEDKDPKKWGQRKVITERGPRTTPSILKDMGKKEYNFGSSIE